MESFLPCFAARSGTADFNAGRGKVHGSQVRRRGRRRRDTGGGGGAHGRVRTGGPTAISATGEPVSMRRRGCSR